MVLQLNYFQKVYLKNTGITLKDHPLMNELVNFSIFYLKFNNLKEKKKFMKTKRVEFEVT